MLTAIIDYESGNLHSAHKAFERMARETDSGDVIVTSDAQVVAGADRIVLPGDGAFPACMSALKGQSGLYDAMVEAVEVKGRPFLGICVGMQLMAHWGREYQDTQGIGWIDGEVIRIDPTDTSPSAPRVRRYLDRRSRLFRAQLPHGGQHRRPTSGPCGLRRRCHRHHWP